MSINRLDGANAYAQALKGFNDTASAASGSDAASGAGSAFSNLIEDSLNDVRDATSTMETTGAQSLNGQADMVEVVTAVSNAELVVDTVVTVRDKVLQAYHEIMKMPV